MGSVFSTLVSKIPKFAAAFFLCYIGYKLYQKLKASRCRKQIQNSDYQPSIIVVGAGFSGLCIGYKLLHELGYKNFQILERHSQVGGTWNTNTYPGCQCDIPSYLYCYSFFQKHDWSESYAKQPEILEYILDFVDKSKLKPHIKLNSEVVNAIYNKEQSKWTVTLSNGKTLTCNIMIQCPGGLNTPKYPKEIKGFDSFKGMTMHAGKWNNDYDFKDKRVVVFGAGTSSIQIVPELQKICQQMYVMQRSPTHVFPKGQRKFGTIVHTMYYYFPFLMNFHRWFLFCLNEMLVYPLLVKKNVRFQKGAIQAFMKHRDSKIPDTTEYLRYLRDAVTPKGYTPGVKRLGISNVYWTAMQQKNCELINMKVETDKIKCIYENGIELMSGRKLDNIDVIVYATGYNVTKVDESRGDLIGRDGYSFAKIFNAEYGPYSYRGVFLNGFPNVLICLGPGAGVGSNSYLVMLEIGAGYVVKHVRDIILNKYKSVEVKRDVEKAFCDKLDARMQEMVWTQDERSWYKMENGRVHTLFGWGSFEWWKQHRNPEWHNFNIEKL